MHLCFLSFPELFVVRGSMNVPLGSMHHVLHPIRCLLCAFYQELEANRMPDLRSIVLMTYSSICARASCQCCAVCGTSQHPRLGANPRSDHLHSLGDGALPSRPFITICILLSRFFIVSNLLWGFFDWSIVLNLVVDPFANLRRRLRSAEICT